MTSINPQQGFAGVSGTSQQQQQCTLGCGANQQCQHLSLVPSDSVPIVPAGDQQAKVVTSVRPTTVYHSSAEPEHIIEKHAPTVIQDIEPVKVEVTRPQIIHEVHQQIVQHEKQVIVEEQRPVTRVEHTETYSQELGSKIVGSSIKVPLNPEAQLGYSEQAMLSQLPPPSAEKQS